MRAYILVIERDLLLRETIIDLLTALGHEAIGTSSSVRGINLLKNLGFDVLITSLGATLIAEPSYALDAKKIQPHLKIVVAAGSDSPDFSELAVDAFIHKPFSLFTLSQTLRKVSIASERSNNRLRLVPQ